MTFLNKLVEIEKNYGKVGTMLGIIIIGTSITASLFTLVAMLKINLQVIEWVFRNLWGFKLY